MAYDEGLAERLRLVMRNNPDVSEKKMFGGLAFMINGYMFIGIVKEELMVRVGKPHHEEALKRPHVRTMDFTGRPMKGYVFVAPEGFESDQMLTDWTDRALRFVVTLPPKK